LCGNVGLDFEKLHKNRKANKKQLFVGFIEDILDYFTRLIYYKEGNKTINSWVVTIMNNTINIS